MTTLPKDTAVLGLLRQIKDLGALDDLAELAGVSRRTVYRQLEDEPPKMEPKTRGRLLGAFHRIGLLVGNDLVPPGNLPELLDAMEDLRRLVRASERGSDDLAAGGVGDTPTRGVA